MIDYQELKRLAEAATPQNFESAEEKVEDGYIECPHCGGSGEVELEADYCNYDNAAIGVQFYGIGHEFGAAEAYYRAANPAAVLALIEEVEGHQGLYDHMKSMREAYGYGSWTEVLTVAEQLKGKVEALTEKYEAARDRKNSITALQVENERLQEEIEMGRDDLLIFKSAVSALGEASKKLVFCARTSGGTAGKDQGLIDACTEVEGVITIGGVAQAMVYVEGLKAEVEALRKDSERYRWTSMEGNWVARMFGKWRAHIGKYGDASPTDCYETREEAIDAAMQQETK